jgi:membrane protein implicated in regulation of membrane protease activity
MAVGLVGLVTGSLLVAYVYPWWVGMLVSAVILVALLFGVGRAVERIKGAA